MANILIVEDELIIASVIEENLKNRNHQVAGTATSFEEAQEILTNTQPDLALLDIKLDGDKTGIDIAAMINSTVQIPFIFLTSFMDGDTIEMAKGTNPAGYLVKPVMPDTLFATIEVALFNHKEAIDKSKDQFWLEDGTKRIPVRLMEIEYILAEENYVHIFCEKRKITIRSTLKKLKQRLPAQQFIQTHRSYIVNLLRIVEATPSEIKLGTASIPVSSGFRTEVMETLGNVGGN